MRHSAIVLLVTIVSCTAAAPRHAQRDSQDPSAAIPPSQEPSTQELNDRFERQIAEEIAGEVDKPAGEVFHNIQLEGLKGEPARRFLVIMNFGYSRALGVGCGHCHDTKAFASDDKRPKRAAREMAIMHRAINDQLRNMRHLETQPASSVESSEIPSLNPKAGAFSTPDAPYPGNVRKHRATFLEASTVFRHPLAATYPDPDHSVDEQRYITIGLSGHGRVLFVAHADHDDRIRIISARKASSRESHAYTQERL